MIIEICDRKTVAQKRKNPESPKTTLKIFKNTFIFEFFFKPQK
jgi:hypothetical protein